MGDIQRHCTDGSGQGWYSRRQMAYWQAHRFCSDTAEKAISHLRAQFNSAGGQSSAVIILWIASASDPPLQTQPLDCCLHLRINLQQKCKFFIPCSHLLITRLKTSLASSLEKSLMWKWSMVLCRKEEVIVVFLQLPLWHLWLMAVNQSTLLRNRWEYT